MKKNQKQVTIIVPVSVAYFINRKVRSHFKLLNWIEKNVPDSHASVARGREFVAELSEYLRQCISGSYKDKE